MILLISFMQNPLSGLEKGVLLKILFILTYLYPRGGDSNHASSVAEGLKKKDHKVEFFGMEDKRNFSDLPGPLAPNVDFRELMNSRSRLRFLKTLRSVYSYSSKKALMEFIENHGPFDLAHVHSVHYQLTMSVLDVLKDKHIPFIWTLHDYKLICPNTSLFNEKIGKPCSSMGKGAPFCVAWHRCKKGNLPASLLTALESSFNNIGGYYEYPACYIAPSTFLGELIGRRKITTRPIRIMPNFSPIRPVDSPESLGKDILYIGRLVQGKGIDLLLKAFSKTLETVSGNLIIVGSGQKEEELKALASGLLPESRYSFTGQVGSAEEISEYYNRAGCVVLSPVWFENLPLSILEAFSFARPVIASDIGGIPELVIDGETGILFEPGSVEGLAEGLIELNDDTEAAKLMGINGWNMVKIKFSKKAYISRLLNLYSDVLQGSR
ncbi:MAG: glycosyltransferase [Candidatus Aegiribacteria sp.]|nr:glycosyltransferase [Candidatus Aegiribacteria sp.]